MSEIIIAGWSLLQETPEQEPLIRDIDLAKRLEYVQPFNIRKLITRLISDGQLSVVSAVETTPDTGRPGREYQLSESQALKVIARSRTKIADKILDEIITVYQAWRQGKIAPVSSPVMASQDLVELRTMVAQLAGAVSSLVSLVSAQRMPSQEPSPSRSLPSPSRALAVQRELIPARAWVWYGAWALKEQWGFADVGELWRHFGSAGGRRGVHSRQTARGYEIRADVVRKIQIQLEE